MLRVDLLARNSHRPTAIQPDQISDVLAEPNCVIWIDVQDPTSHDFDLLAQEFKFHPLALEDARVRHQRPKLDEYDGFLFIVFYAARLTSRAMPFDIQEISLFVGPNYLVTVHEGAVPEIEATARRWNENVTELQARGIAVLLYSLLDTIVDGYFPVLDRVAERSDTLEDAIFDRRDAGSFEEIFQLRKALLALRRVIAPERDLLSMLTRRDIALLGPATAIYFGDIYDHVLRVTDAIDTYRDLLASALEAYLSVVSNNLNQVMRTLTAWSIILMTLALVAGIYGMNVPLTPSQGWPLGFPLIMSFMAALGLALFLMFKRIRWL